VTRDSQRQFLESYRGAMQLLFIHGAGGFVEDRVIVDGLRSSLRAPVEMPQMPDDDMSVEAWAAPVRRHLAVLGAEGVVIGHSFGATILQWVLPERAWAPKRVLLLATPDWSPDAWDIAQYVHHGPEPRMEVSLHHCRDDDVVPFDHLALNAVRLPSARVCEHLSGGHQFDGLVETIAEEALRSS
jgi:predicted alpha/beta hydrolase family esterase